MKRSRVIAAVATVVILLVIGFALYTQLPAMTGQTTSSGSQSSNYVSTTSGATASLGSTSAGSPATSSTASSVGVGSSASSSTLLTTAGSGALAPIALGSAANFAILAGTSVTNTGASTVGGNLGVSTGTSVTGFPPGSVTGASFTGASSAAGSAQTDLTAAFNDAAGRSVGAVTVSGNLGGMTLTPGLYKSTSSLAISSGDLTLSCQGNANGVFIFQIASSLTTTSGRQVILSGGCQDKNIFWQVGSSATLGTTSVLHGTILAQASITMNTGATLVGRALARSGDVTLAATTITLPGL